MPGRRLLITSKTVRRGFNRQVYGLEGSGCFAASARPWGVIAIKLQLNHPRKISFFLGTNVEVNPREIMGRRVQNEKWDQVSLDHVRTVFELPRTVHHHLVHTQFDKQAQKEACFILRRKSKCFGIALIMATVLDHAIRFT